MLREALDNLSINLKRQLLLALEQGIAQYVRIGEDRYIGVNVAGLRQQEIIESIGDWSYGRIK